MFGTAKHSSSFDGIVIDDRNERPLAVALATILVVWSVAFAMTFASGHSSRHHADWVGAAIAITSPTGR
jgi:hypothetical protein